ncbi:hypothetical protein [Aurantibacter sp.]|uniref:Spy/CpxP family protein refolding chaperone n=1 Tax=Aurantibacter sp. TaxID=2807103 RepID=UPI003264D20C
MKKNLLLYILLGFLIIMNGFFLVRHFGNIGNKRPDNIRPSNFIAKELQFDEKQMKQFKKLNTEHRKEIRILLDDIRKSKDDMFGLLTAQNVSDQLIDSITTIVANKNKKKEIATFKFFRAVNEICNEEQTERFSLILKDALHQRGPDNQDGPPPGGRGPESGPPPPPGP